MASYKLTASIGSTVVGKDVLFTVSHPSHVKSSMTKNPQYSAISSVPFKDLSGQQSGYRRMELLSEVEKLEMEFLKQKEIVRDFGQELVSDRRKKIDE